MQTPVCCFLNCWMRAVYWAIGPPIGFVSGFTDRKTQLRNTPIITAVLVATLLWGGCAGQKEVACYWRGHGVVADGIDKEWPESPQYYDKDRRITVRVINSDEILSLTVATGSRSLQRHLQMAGLTVWFDPEGGNEQIFGLHLPAANMRPKGPPPGGPPGDGGLGTRIPHNQTAENFTAKPGQRPPVLIGTISEMEITYSDTTGPLRMKMDEVRRTGIDVGRTQTDEGRLVYEFNIHFNAAPSLEQLKPGMVLGIGILAASTNSQTGGPPGPSDVHRAPTLSLGGMGGPGGGPGGPGTITNGPGRGGGRPESLEIWLKVRLAGPPIG